MDRKFDLPIAVRAYAVPKGYEGPRPGRRNHKPWPSLTLTFNCSSILDGGERLTYGSYLVKDSDRVIDKGFFYDESLDQDAIGLLRKYVNQRNTVIVYEDERLRVLPRARFIKEIFLKVAYDSKGATVGFNLPSQISLISVGWANARAKGYQGGFSFTLNNYVDKEGRIKPDSYTPRIACKPIDGRRARMGFTSSRREDSSPEKGTKGDGFWPFRGYFVDCRVFAYALTNNYFDLEGACTYFGVPDYSEDIDYPPGESFHILRDLEQRVGKINQLYQRLLSDYTQHQISLHPNRAYSPASIGKAYLREARIKPQPLDIANNLKMTPNEVLGAAMASYCGARTECRIRDVVFPVVYVDFMSMYPTVHTLMGMDQFHSATKLRVEDWTQEACDFLEKINPMDLFLPERWKLLPVLVKVLSDNDVFPVRAKYTKSNQGAYTLAVNKVTSPIPLWYTLPDCIASKVMTGKTPKVVEAIRFIPVGTQKNLKPINILGMYELDPKEDDIFKVFAELRNKIKLDMTIEPELRSRRSDNLKSIVTSSSYGIFIELNRQEGEEATVEVHGLETFSCNVEAPEYPGEFFSPITGTQLTGAGRLMMALLEYEITRRGGSYVFMDTDSAAIVATKDGGLIPCPGGTHHLEDGTPAVKALCWAEVDEIIALFDQLNPYDRNHVPSSILKLEEENFIGEGNNKLRIEPKCLSISSKRYVLFYEDESGIQIQKASEHGLGNYVKPIDRETGQEVPNWIEYAWQMIIRANLRRPPLDTPEWLKEFVLTRVQLSTPTMMEWVDPLNEKLKKSSKNGENSYRAIIKPFNIIEHVLLSSIFFKKANSDQRVCLISPSNELWPLQRSWVNIHDQEGGSYWIVSPKRSNWGGNTFPGRTYQELINRHSLQPESKFLTYKHEPCSWMSKGILRRRHVHVVDVVHIGKEANEIDKVQAGLIDYEEEVLLKYEKDPWDNLLPLLAEMNIPEIQNLTGYSRSMAYALRSGERRPSRVKLAYLRRILAKRSTQTDSGELCDQ